MPTYGKVKVNFLTHDVSGSAVELAVNNIATKASPTFTGTVTVPTPSANDNSTKAASTAYVQTELGDYALKAGPTFTGTVNAADLVLSGDLTVQGTTTTIDTTTLQVEDKNIEIGKVSTPSDVTADGGGWTLKGATDKTFNWVNATDAWTSSEHIHLGDDKKLLIGTGSDLQIYHDASNSFIKDSGTGNLFIDASITYLRNAAGDEHLANFNSDGAVNLYHNGVLKVATSSSGATVSGTLAATAVTGDGSGLTNLPPGGNTVDLVADGAIAAGKPVIITTAGKAKQVAELETGLDQLVRNTGSETQQNSHGSTDDHYLERAKKNCVAYNAGNDTMFVLLRTSGHNTSNNQVVAYVYASQGTNADNLIIEKIEAITAANQSNSGKMCVCALSSNRYFVAYYRSDTDAGVRCKIITIGSNGSTWSAGSEYHIGGTSGASNVDYMSATETTTNRVCILARSNDDSRPTLIIGDITSNNVWNDRRNELISNDTSDQPWENQLHYDATDDVLCGIYETSQNNVKLVGMRVAAGTGAAVTVGTIVDITGSSTGGKNSVAFHSASGNWVTAWRDNSSPHDINYQVHTINSSTLAITSGTAITRSSGNAQHGIALSVTAENRIVSTYIDHNQYIQSEVFTISGTTIASAGAPVRLMSSWAQFDRHGSVYMSHNSRMAIFGTRGSNGLYYGTADTTGIATNLASNNRNFIGFAESAINDTASGTIKLKGNIVGGQSGLTPGTLYKVNDNGTLTADWVSNSVGLRAIASDKGQIIENTGT